MLARIYELQDYQDLRAWWDQHKKLGVTSDVLPFGVVVEKDGVKSAMTFVYTMDGCNVAQIAWTTSNPNLGMKERYRAVNAAIDSALTYIRAKNINNVMCFSDSLGLAKLLIKKGLRLGNDHTLSFGSY